MPALEGRCLQDRYIIHNLIGRGAYGRVFRAEQVSLHRDIAVKVIGPLSADDDFLDVFHNEAFAVSRLAHPNVVSIYDYGRTDDGFFYIAMEYVRGRTLARLIAEDGTLASNRAVNLILQVLGALEEAHGAGVIHSDLKSENIMVQDLRGAGELVKVIDFGIARLVGEAMNHRAQWATTTYEEGRISGTPQYMAPEVIAGHKPSIKADIYAVGVVLYHMLTGTLPFVGGSSVEIMVQHLQAPVPPPTVQFEHLNIPPELEDIVLRALAKEPEDRFPDASSLCDALLAVKTADCTRLALSAAGGNDNAAGCLSDKCSEQGWQCSTQSQPVSEPGIKRLALFDEGSRAPEQPCDHDNMELWRSAVRVSAQLGEPGLLIETATRLADELIRHNAANTAIVELKQAAEQLSSHNPLPKELWRVHVRLARLYKRTDDVPEALSWAESAYELARCSGSDSGEEQAGALITELGRRHGDIQ